MDNKELDGWEIPIHLSLIRGPMIAGLKREVAVAIWSLAFFLAGNFWMIHFLPIAGIIHLALAYLTKHDPDFVECLLRSLKYKRFYE